MALEINPSRRFRALIVAALLLFTGQYGFAQIPGQSEKAKKIGRRLMCMCGCNQVLIECNHVGCSMSTAMLEELDERIARNEPEDLLIQSFVQQYGEKVLAQPPAKNFGLVAWIMPVVATLIGLFVIRVVLRRWRPAPAAAGMPAAAPDVSPEFLERARREMDLEEEFDRPAPGGKKA